MNKFYLLFIFTFVLTGCINNTIENDTISSSIKNTLQDNLLVDNEEEETFNTTIDEGINGTYLMGNIKGDAGGGVLVIQLNSEGFIKFELEINNGAPRFHSGIVTGEMSFSKGVATFETNDFDDLCRITFTLSSEKIKIDQVEGNDFDCGLGHGVMAFGTYTKHSEEVIFKFDEAI